MQGCLTEQSSLPLCFAVVPPPTLTLAQAYGPTSATATASGAANISWASWQFTATPASGTAFTQRSDTPVVWWYALAANTPCEYGCRGLGAGRDGGLGRLVVYSTPAQLAGS